MIKRAEEMGNQEAGHNHGYKFWDEVKIESIFELSPPPPCILRQKSQHLKYVCKI